MTAILKHISSASSVLACTLVVACGGSAFAWDGNSATGEKPAAVQNAVYNGYSCDHVRAKVAESGITAAYAYARYMGMTSRDIARVRKACAV